MNKFTKYSAIVLAGLALVTSCNISDRFEVLDTAQYSDSQVTLASFGPNPVMRGATLRFFGSNLDQVKEVRVPGVDPITTIEVVTAGKVGEIRVQLPAEGTEPGYVTLVTKNNKEIVTKSELTYTEPIEFDKFTVSQPAYPGDVITLEGDYMNLVHHVIFEGGESVEVLEGATRHKAEVVIPATAISGKIILSDGADIENLLYSTEDLNIGSPSVTRLSLINTKPGDTITFTGKHLEMIKAIDFPKQNDGTLSVEEFEMGEKGITLTVPQEAADGYVYAISYAEGRYEIYENKCIMPSEVAVTNTPKAGSQLLISGSDLDVVAKVDLAGAENAAFELAEDVLKVTVPATAIEGKAKLYHSNGASVEVEYTLVHPTISAVSPLEIFAGDEPVIVTGTDLDLVAAAKIGTKDVEISEQSETSLTLATAVTSVGGKVILTLANGETLESTEEVVMNYHSKVTVTSRPEAEHIGMTVVLKGEKLDLVESIFIGEAKVTKYILRTAEEIQFLMPWNKVGSYELKFQLFDGDIEVQSEPIGVLLELQTIVAFEGSVDIAWAAPGQIIIPGSKVGKVAAGSIIRLYFTQHDQTWGQIQVNDGSWVKILPEIVPTDIFGWFEDGILDRVYDIVLTKAQADQINAADGLVIQGQDETLTKVEIINEIPQEVTIWEGSQKVSWNDNDPWLDAPGSKALSALAYGAYDWSTVSAGTTLIVHLKCIPDAGYSQIRYGNGNWAALPGTPDTKDLASDATSDSLVLTQEMINELVNANGLVLCGHGYEITAVGLL